MKKLDNLMTKKSILLLSALGSIIGFLITGLTMLKFWCGNGNYECWNKFELPGHLLLIFLPMLILSLITYFLREETFRSWVHFAYGWVPLTLLMTYLASGSSGGGFGIPNVFDAEFVSLVFSFFFLVISLVIIIYKSLKNPSHK